MELYQEILSDIFSKNTIQIEIKNISGDIHEIIESNSYKLLKEIHDIIREDTDDKECFEKIEKIILLFENMGSDCGGRHDF